MQPATELLASSFVTDASVLIDPAQFFEFNLWSLAYNYFDTFPRRGDYRVFVPEDAVNTSL